MELKKFVNIENLREEDVDLGNGFTRKRNDLAFQAGDTISITEKIDGSNASFCHDEEGMFFAFSRRKALDYKDTMSGFYNFVQELNHEAYKDAKDYSIFGEWLRKVKIAYDKEKMNRFYAYDIYDKASGKWLLPDAVKEFCKQHELEYIHELYYGPFISWEHCKGFLNNPAYGEKQEGIVVRNVSAMEREDRNPCILKVVNEFYKEVKMKKTIDPEAEAEKAMARMLMESIVTENRVQKEICKLKEDGIIPAQIVPEDMGKIAKVLPKKVFEDCQKEESEIVQRAGKYAGKMCASISMMHARNYLLG